MLPFAPIASLLIELDHRTGFLDCFTHAGGHKQARSVETKRNILAVLIANATNVGLRHCVEVAAYVYDPLRLPRGSRQGYGEPLSVGVRRTARRSRRPRSPPARPGLVGHVQRSCRSLGRVVPVAVRQQLAWLRWGPSCPWRRGVRARRRRTWGRPPARRPRRCPGGRTASGPRPARYR